MSHQPGLLLLQADWQDPQAANFDRLSKYGRTVSINAGTKDVKVYDRDGRMICWISGSVRNRYVVYDVEEVTTADRKAIDAYAGLPTEERR